MVVVVEDAHWADEATLDALRVLGRRVDGTRGLVIATYRDDEVESEHPLRTAAAAAIDGGLLVETLPSAGDTWLRSEERASEGA